jgi:hypothetical protein
MSRLEARGEVTHLGFPGSMTQNTVGRLFTSPLAATLTHLDLSSCPGLKTRGVKAVAENAHVFEALEVLSLSGTKTSSVTAGEFARADWAPSFGFLDLRGAHSKGGGVLAFLDAGRVDLLCPPGEDTLLDLSWFQIWDDELALIMSHPELARVKGLSLYGNPIKHIEPLLESEQLGVLHTLDVSCTQLTSPAESVLDLVSKTTPSRFFLRSTRLFEDADVAALCALEVAGGFEQLDLLGAYNASDFGPEALDALLTLEARGRLAAVTFAAAAPEGDPVLERARENGRYHVGPKVNAPGMFSVWRLDRVDPD